ncbi:MAG: Phenylacetic acid catabolic protein [Sulfitobacter sp.]
MTNDDMTITDYIEAGGKLTSPENVPPRHRAELMRLMAIFVDSELAGAAGFADMINAGPGVKERIAAARIVLEKTDHAGRVLRLMGEFGANIDRYADHHPWTERMARGAAPSDSRPHADMRLRVFDYPLSDWGDAVVMNLLMGKATAAQLTCYSHTAYQPLAEVMRDILPVEIRHAELAEEGLAKLTETQDRTALQASVAYWWPKVETSFGARTDSKRAEILRNLGLPQEAAETARAKWQADAADALKALGLTAP